MSDEQEKEVAYYSAIVNGWLTTRLEHDKSILTLSSGGIGLLVTLLMALGAATSTIFILFVFAAVSFLVAIISVVTIFKRNATHLEKVAKKEESTDPILRLLDNLVSYSFLVGVLFTLAIGLSVGVKSLQSSKEYEMSKDKSIEKMVDSSAKVEKKSFDGIANLEPDQSGGNTESNQGVQSGSQQSDQQQSQDGDKK